MADLFSTLTRIPTHQLRPGHQIAYRDRATNGLIARTVVAVWTENGQTSVEMTDIAYHAIKGQMWPLMPQS